MLIALFFGFYHLWDRLYVDLLHIPDPDALFQSREFRNGEYADIDTRRYLGPSGGFAVLDAQGQPLYVSTSRIPAIQTPDELLCVADFDAGDTVTAVPFEAQDGQQCWIVIRDLMLEDDLTQTEVMILDEDPACTGRHQPDPRQNRLHPAGTGTAHQPLVQPVYALPEIRPGLLRRPGDGTDSAVQLFRRRLPGRL